MIRRAIAWLFARWANIEVLPLGITPIERSRSIDYDKMPDRIYSAHHIAQAVFHLSSLKSATVMAWPGNILILLPHDGFGPKRNEMIMLAPALEQRLKPYCHANVKLMVKAGGHDLQPKIVHSRGTLVRLDIDDRYL